MVCKTEFNNGKREQAHWVGGVALDGDGSGDEKAVGWGNGRGTWGYGVITYTTHNIFVRNSVQMRNK